MTFASRSYIHDTISAGAQQIYDRLTPRRIGTHLWQGLRVCRPRATWKSNPPRLIGGATHRVAKEGEGGGVRCRGIFWQELRGHLHHDDTIAVQQRTQFVAADASRQKIQALGRLLCEGKFPEPCTARLHQYYWRPVDPGESELRWPETCTRHAEGQNYSC